MPESSKLEWLSLILILMAVVIFVSAVIQECSEDEKPYPIEPEEPEPAEVYEVPTYDPRWDMPRRDDE